MPEREDERYSTGQGAYYWQWQREIERRIALIEAVKPDVLNDRVASLISEVRSLKRSFYTFAFAVASGSILIAISSLHP